MTQEIAEIFLSPRGKESFSYTKRNGNFIFAYDSSAGPLRKQLYYQFAINNSLYRITNFTTISFYSIYGNRIILNSVERVFGKKKDDE